MLIKEAIEKIKAYHRGEVNGQPIDEKTSRDQVLYGDPNQQCRGIVTTCWASVEVIKKAADLQANLIIVHEALFWNRGDKTAWLQESANQTFLAKKQLLDETGIVVWRNHDFVHSGIPLGGEYVDGIFYGVAKLIGWLEYQVSTDLLVRTFVLPLTTVEDLGRQLIEKFGLNGLRIIGKPEDVISKVAITFHIMGEFDQGIITIIEKEKIEAIIALEITDFTVSEYIRDSSLLGFPKAVFAVGHFNVEEPGMAYMVEYLPQALGAQIPCTFVKSGDMYDFITK